MGTTFIIVTIIIFPNLTPEMIPLFGHLKTNMVWGSSSVSNYRQFHCDQSQRNPINLALSCEEYNPYCLL